MPENNQEQIANGRGPYFDAPYPKNIVQVHEGETAGEREVARLINRMWPAKISTLEAEAGYSGSFIRNVLRHNFARAEDVDEEDVVAEPSPVEEAEAEVLERNMMESRDDWSEAFRAGLKLALKTDLSEEEASDAIGSGFLQGREIKEEIAAGR